MHADGGVRDAEGEVSPSLRDGSEILDVLAMAFWGWPVDLIDLLSRGCPTLWSIADNFLRRRRIKPPQEHVWVECWVKNTKVPSTLGTETTSKGCVGFWDTMQPTPGEVSLRRTRISVPTFVTEVTLTE